MKLSNSLKSIALLSVIVLIPSSCGTTRTGSDVRSGNSAKVLTFEQWEKWGDDMIMDIYASNVLARYEGTGPQAPGVLAIDDFKVASANWRQGTNFQRTKDVMYNTIRQSMVNNSKGKLVVSMDVTGRTETAQQSSILKDRGGLRGSTEYDQSTTIQAGTLRAPTVSMWGMIISQELDTGHGKRLYEYAINIRLVDLTHGGTVFERQYILPGGKEYWNGIFGT